MKTKLILLLILGPITFISTTLANAFVGICIANGINPLVYVIASTFFGTVTIVTYTKIGIQIEKIKNQDGKLR